MGKKKKKSNKKYTIKSITEKQSDAIIQNLLEGATITKACIAAGCSRQHYYEMIYSDKDFKKKAEDAIASRISVVADSLYTNAVKGNVVAQIFFLCNRCPSQWQNVQRIDANIKSDSPKVITLIPDNTLVKRLEDPNDDITKPPVIK